MVVAAKAAALAVLGNYGAHVGSGYIYSMVCLPQDVWDVARSVVTTASPVCSGLITTMQMTQNNFAVSIAAILASLTAAALKD